MGRLEPGSYVLRKAAITAFLLLLLAAGYVLYTAPKPEAWERRSGFDFENRGVARLENGPGGWLLTIQCGETHSFRVDYAPNSAESFVGKNLRVRYSKSKKSQAVQCITAPCPPIEVERYVIMQMTVLSDEDARKALEECGSKQASVLVGSDVGTD